MFSNLDFPITLPSARFNYGMMSDNMIADACIDYCMIEPFHMEQVQPASYDLTLSDDIYSMVEDEHWILDHGNPFIDASDKSIHGLTYRKTKIHNSVYRMRPGEFILASTVERVHIPTNVAARFEGKSSLGRIGLTTHITAGFVDPGFDGQITLEMKNETRYDISIKPGMKIGQICFFMLGCLASRPYGSAGLGSHYQGQEGATVARS